ncbi:Sec-independent protein translocase protein TatB [Salinisphaera japonica]|uniref:Sec-independent protein translocase protein TatB n=1 Tax=Salinisphaera japonica YTM-1 TaxID=1209778 RepID=A0A423Q0Y6_9GAMM|nr:Sec-independent protein translocase protein TatB [Salinisphaera japonica]ROO31922.1 preprotein translocase subunit TatB [Salinisphaera japonica YTM-1]
MFDIGFWELSVLAVIGLIVLGPERLPVVARTMGRWVGQAKHYMSALTSELEREVKADDIRREVREAREQIESETRQARDNTDREVDSVMRPLKSELERDAADDKSASTPTSKSTPKSTDKDRNT